PHPRTSTLLPYTTLFRSREDQYSALLKSVEEPGASTLWVLTTARLARVPATIRSRCQRVRFAPLAESVVSGVLRSQAGLDERSADRKSTRLNSSHQIISY